MENTVQSFTERSLEADSLLLARFVLKDVRWFIRDVRMIVTILLRYVAIGASIINSLLGSIPTWQNEMENI